MCYILYIYILCYICYICYSALNIAKICATNFRTRKLDSSETMCMDRCFEKFVKYTQRLSTAFQEQNLLAADEMQQPK